MIPLQYEIPKPVRSNNLQYYFTRRSTGELQLHINGNGGIGRSMPFEPYREEIVDLFIEDGIKSIPRQAFADMSALEHVELPASLREIGKYAFKGCGNLLEVIFYGSLKSWMAMNGDLALPEHFPRQQTPIAKDHTFSR